MNIPKAIELNKEAENSLRKGKHPDHADAVALGIEALKRDVHNRLVNNHPDQAKLPGETEE